MCQFCDWEGSLIGISDMLSSGSYEWAGATLEGVRGAIRQAEHITAEQRHAVSRLKMRSEP